MARRLRSAYRRRRFRFRTLAAAAALGAVAGVALSVWLAERIAATGLEVGPAELRRFGVLTLAMAGLGWGIAWLILRAGGRREAVAAVETGAETGNLSSPS